MKTKLFKSAILSTAALSLAFGVSTANANVSSQSDILFILDGSGSMWGQIDGVAKIDTAKATLTKMLSDVPQSARLGLMTYGTKDKTSCEDVTYTNPLGSARGAISQTIASLSPLGKTPIDRSLAHAVSQLANTQPHDVQKSLVLISDGIETCDGAPCETAKAAQASGVSLKVHVVGFNVDRQARNQLECIAQHGGGKYFDAADTAGFQKAIADVVEVAQAPIEIARAPEPEPFASKPFFIDEFDGEALGTAWTVGNADEEAYLVEESSLLMVSSKQQGFATAEPTNLVSLSEKLPKGDWDMNLYMKIEAQTKKDSFWFGLHKDPQNYMGLMLYTGIGNPCAEFAIRLEKASKGERTKFDTRIAGSKACGWGHGGVHEAIQSAGEDGIVLTIAKRGRNYTASARLEGIVGDTGTPKTVSTKSLTSLKLPGKPSMMLGKWGNADGEILSFVDRFEIVPVK
ncbi:MAG: VWA domain-containing protein [Pseudomonadota bacterium]